MPMLEFIRQHLPQEKELIFFGGSFNPWHEGHEACIKLMDPQKKIVVLPDHNPYKEFIDNKLTNIDQIKSFLDNYPNTYIFEGFFDAQKKNPTIHWLYEVKQAFKEKKLSLLMGFDTFMGIDKWIKAHELLNILDTIYVASRLDNPEQKEAQTKVLRSINPDLSIQFLGNHPHEELSSTALRNK
jgi:nicotinate-nucleotide adenylyltransferase